MGRVLVTEKRVEGSRIGKGEDASMESDEDSGKMAREVREDGCSSATFAPGGTTAGETRVEQQEASRRETETRRGRGGGGGTGKGRGVTLSEKE